MRKFILPLLFISITPCWASGPSEEAIVLNQELQFLEEQASGTRATYLEGSAAMRKRKVIEDNLERKYFKDAEEDTVSTKTAGPKRRQAR